LNQLLFQKNKSVASDSFNLLLVLTGAALIIRLPGLEVPLFGDEATTFWEHATSSYLTLFSQYNGPNQHSLFSFLSNISMQVFGENEISFRLPSFFAGILVIPLIFLAGKKFMFTSQTSLLAAFLACFSTPLIEQSQQGRGYTLTVAIALVVLITGKNILSEKHDWPMSLVFIFSGFSMVLILPTNIYFLAAFGFFLFVDYAVKNKNEKRAVKLLLKGLPVFLMVGLASAYLLFIYDDLQRGLETYRSYAKGLEGLPSLEPTIIRSLEIFSHLAKPWGMPLCLIFLFGYWKFNNPNFLLIFILPLAFNFISGVQGPPRSYYYWIPFFMLMAANGLFVFYVWVKSLLPQRLNKVAFAVFILILIFKPVIFLKNYFENRFEIKFAKIEHSKKALEFIKELPRDYLVLIPWEDRVLRHYTEKRVAENMLNILREGNLNGIISISYKSISPEKNISGLFNETSFLPEYFKLIEQRGSLNIYKFDFLITKIFPLEKGFDFQNLMNNLIPSGIKMKTEKKHKIVGKQSLKVEGTGSPGQVVSKFLMSVNLPPGTAFIFYLYAQKLDQKSKAGLMVSRKRDGKSNVLNYLFGIFREENGELHWVPEHPYRNFRQVTKKKGEFHWQIVMIANPIEVGINHFKEALKIKSEISYFDAMQAYILHSTSCCTPTSDQIPSTPSKIFDKPPITITPSY
jgi:hypothetical protein